MAAQLVADGVPMAVGMAGEVADGACRIFTCAFYEALLEGKPVALASARGRRAALRRYSAYHDTVEWARPGLFVASHCQAMLPIAGATVDLTQIAGTFLKLKKPRAFCDRLKCLNEFEALLRRIAKQGGRYALGFGVDPRSDSTLQYGKTRLLEELAARLVLEGFAPVVVSGSTRSSDDPPDTLHGLAIRIGQAISTTRKNFGLPARDRTEALKFALAESGVEWDGEGGASLQIAVNAIRRKLADRKYEAAGIRALISRDLAKLIADLKDWGITHAALLIDDLDKFDGAALPLLDTLDQFGLGEPPHVIPLLFTYTRGSDKGIFLFMEQRVYPDVTLGPFLDPEDLLAHRQFLLTRPVEPVAVNAHRDKRKDVAEMYDEFRQLTSGVPSRWEASTFEQTVKVCRRFNLLLDADDEEILKSYG
jgi:hypothetical protein